MFPSEFSARFTDLRNSHTLPSRYSEEKKTLSQVGLSEGIFHRNPRMPLYVSLVLKGTNSHVFAVVVALQTCSCMLSYPVHIDPRPPPLRGRSYRLLLMSWFLLLPLYSHPAPIFQMPCPLQPVCDVLCTALCVCHVHSVDVLSAPPFLHFSHLHCVSLRPGCSSLRATRVFLQTS